MSFRFKNVTLDVPGGTVEIRVTDDGRSAQCLAHFEHVTSTDGSVEAACAGLIRTMQSNARTVEYAITEFLAAARGRI